MSNKNMESSAYTLPCYPASTLLNRTSKLHYEVGKICFEEFMPWKVWGPISRFEICPDEGLDTSLKSMNWFCAKQKPRCNVVVEVRAQAIVDFIPNELQKVSRWLIVPIALIGVRTADVNLP